LFDLIVNGKAKSSKVAGQRIRIKEAQGASRFIDKRTLGDTNNVNQTR